MNIRFYKIVFNIKSGFGLCFLSRFLYLCGIVNKICIGCCLELLARSGIDVYLEGLKDNGAENDDYPQAGHHHRKGKAGSKGSGHSPKLRSYIVTRNGKSYVLDDSLDAVEAGLDPKAFFRISRGAIIAENVIDSAGKLLGGRLRLTLKPGIPASTDLTVSRARADAFLDWLEG